MPSVRLLATCAAVALSVPLAVGSAPAHADRSPTGDVALSPLSSAYVCDTDDVRETGPGPVVDDPGAPRAVRNGGGDMAFSGDTAVVLCGGDDRDLANDGFAVVDIADRTAPRVVSTFACVASASDLAMVGDLVFLAVDRNNDTTGHRGPLSDRYAAALGLKTGCEAPVVHRGKLLTAASPGLRNVEYPLPDTEHIFTGIRVVSIADPAAPRLITSVPMPEDGFGAHTLTALRDPARGRILVYVSSPPLPQNRILAVPLADPAAVEVVNPEFKTGLAGCHDMSFFLPRGLMACARHGGGTMLFDVRDDEDDPYDTGAALDNPVRIKRPGPDGTLVDKGLFYEPRREDSCDTAGVQVPPAFVLPTPATPTAPVDCPPVPKGPVGHHSVAFSWDGRTMAITDEYLALTAAYAGKPCTDGSGPRGHNGSVFFFDISDPATPTLLSHQLPPQVANGVCVSKQLNVIPLADGRDVAVVSWLGGGTSVIDFTDPRQPRQLAAYVAAPGTPDRSYPWASYFYDGHVFVNNAAGCNLGVLCEGTYTRGLEVLELSGLGPTQPMEEFDFGRQVCRGSDGREELPDCARS